jgi:hypothetical protein
VTIVVLAPFAVLAVWTVVHGGVAPSGDVALLEVRVGDVGSRWTPLVGSYQRFGFNQPGPLLLYALALPYRLLGRRYVGLSLGALVIGALSASCVLRVAWRRGGRIGLLWAAALLAVLVHGFGPGWLVDPWEPHVLALVAAALFALACDVALGRVAALPWVVVAASLIAQAWGTMLVFAVALAAWATLAVVVHAGRSAVARRDAFRSLLVASVVGFVLWLPPMLDQLTQSPGNVTAALDALGSPAEPAVGLADGMRAVGSELGVPASWLGFRQRLDGLSPTLDLDVGWSSWLGLLALAAATIGAARLRGRERAWVVGATALIGVVGAVIAMARLLGPLFVWLPQWLRVVGMTTWFAIGWCAASVVPEEGTWPTRVRPAVEAILAAVVALFVLLTIVDVVTPAAGSDPLGTTARALVADAAADIDALDGGPVLVTSVADAPLALGGDDVALEVLVLAVERGHRSTRVRADLATKYGKGRADPSDAHAELRLARADDVVPEGFRVVAERDPLAAAQRARRTELLQQLGLPASATDADAIRTAAADPAAQPTVRRLRRLPDLPRLRLLLAELPDQR